MAVRQVEIDEPLYEAVRQRAKVLRISEDELIRRAIDKALAEPESASLAAPSQALADFLDAARAVREGGTLAEPYNISVSDAARCARRDLQMGSLREEGRGIGESRATKDQLAFPRERGLSQRHASTFNPPDLPCRLPPFGE